VKNLFYIPLSELVVLPLLVIAQEPSRQTENPSDRRDEEAFLHMSAVDVSRKYFESPPYRLFAIRRLIELGDPVVVPVLHRAFADETEVTRRQFIAAALVSLGDPDPDYFKYVADEARRAIKSDLPFPVPLSGTSDSKSRPLYRPEFLKLVQERGLEFRTALQKCTFQLPGAVEALGDAGDPRSFSILVQGLHSPNIMIVRAAAFGLARSHDNSGMQPVIEACLPLPLEERRMIAKSLLYFDNHAAQERARMMIADPTLFERWQAEVRQRGWKRAMGDPGH
jgi:HEAT repeat protein